MSLFMRKKRYSLISYQVRLITLRNDCSSSKWSRDRAIPLFMPPENWGSNCPPPRSSSRTTDPRGKCSTSPARAERRRPLRHFPRSWVRSLRRGLMRGGRMRLLTYLSSPTALMSYLWATTIRPSSHSSCDGLQSIFDDHHITISPLFQKRL